MARGCGLWLIALLHLLASVSIAGGDTAGDDRGSEGHGGGEGEVVGFPGCAVVYSDLLFFSCERFSYGVYWGSSRGV